MVDNVVQVAIHVLRRKGPNEFEFILGKDHLNLSPTVIRVVEELHGLYSSKASKAYGAFAEDAVNYPAQTFIGDFEKGGYRDFATLTKNLMGSLTVQAQTRSAAGGGNVLFAHFVKDAQVYLMVAVVTEKLGALLTSDLDVKDVTHLDFEGFRFAGRVNVTSWLNGGDRYIGFLKGKGNVAEYFKEFLGCTTTRQDKTDTTRLIEALEEFSEPAKGHVSDRAEFLQRAFAICQRYAREDMSLDFETFANELFPAQPEVLTKALADPNRALGDGFKPNQRALSALVRYRAATPYWSLDLDRRAIAEGKASYDPERRTLTLRELPEALIAKLDRNSESDAVDHV